MLKRIILYTNLKGINIHKEDNLKPKDNSKNREESKKNGIKGGKRNRVYKCY